MRVLSTVRFTLLRMMRYYIVLLLLLVVPIALLTFFSWILSGAVMDNGEPYINDTALSLVLCFQLFGGSVVMSMIHSDFFTENRIRIHVLPFNHTLYAFSIMLCGTLYSVMLGVIQMAYTEFVLGVQWHSWLWMVYLITLMSLLSSIVCLIFTFMVKSFKLAERLSEIYGVGFVVLAGLFFPLPDHPVFHFLGSYGNPLTLSTGAIREMSRSHTGEAWLQANILLITIVVLFIVMLVVGRRRMARDHF